jgi:hypothetical protein
MQLRAEELYIIRMLFGNVEQIKQNLQSAQVAYLSYFNDLQTKYGEGKPIAIDIATGNVTIEGKKE